MLIAYHHPEVSTDRERMTSEAGPTRHSAVTETNVWRERNAAKLPYCNVWQLAVMKKEAMAPIDAECTQCLDLHCN
jgi:hypothetical protein